MEPHAAKANLGFTITRQMYSQQESTWPETA
jgi:hypothetical protein